MEVLHWLKSNWFNLFQSLALVGSLLFTGLSLRIDAKVRRVSNRLEIAKQHREIWSHLYARPELKRVLDASADLQAKPTTSEERMFVTFLVIHLAGAHRAEVAHFHTPPQKLGADIRHFFSFPVPRAVWQTLKHSQDEDFVRFVDEELRA